MNKFAFIIHPLKINDLARKYNWACKIPDRIIKRFIRMMPAVKASHITGIKSHTGKEIEGYFIGCTLTSEQMLSLPTEKVIKKIVAAGRKAEELGAEIVGLGAFTSVVGDKGISIADKLNIPVTTGNSYTVATAIEGTRMAVKKMGYETSTCSIAVIGATGSIGRAISLIMSREYKKIYLAGRNKSKLKLLAEEIKENLKETEIEITTDIKHALSSAEVVISASGAVEALIKPSYLKTGAVVCDVARPRDVAVKVIKERDDVLVIEGGIVKIPGAVDFNFDFGYPSGTAYACMAETMILTLENINLNYSLGPIIEVNKIKEISRLARRHGFKLAGLRCFDSALPEEKIIEIKANAQKKH